jgi:hypothetical protein
MKNWMDRIWQLFLIIVAASILTFCRTGNNNSAKNDNGTSSDEGSSNGGGGVALANGFKPSDIVDVMICDGIVDYKLRSSTPYFKNCMASDNTGFITYNCLVDGCSSSTYSFSRAIKFTDAIAQGWRPVGPLYSAGSSTYSNDSYASSPTIFYK